MGLFDKLKNAGGDSLSQPLGNSLGKLTSMVNVDATKAMAVSKACKVNYDKSMETINSMDYALPNADAICSTLNILKYCATEYNNSSSPTREDEYINRVMKEIDAKTMIEVIEPVVDMIPGGSMIVIGLKYIAKKQKSK